MTAKSRLPKALTPQNLRNYKGLEHLTDEEAERIHAELTQLAALLIRIYPLEKIRKEMEGKD